jgi:hypothetical protein
MKLPYMGAARWVLAGTILLGMILVLQSHLEPGAGREGLEPQKALSVGDREDGTGGTTQSGPELHPLTADIDPERIAMGRHGSMAPEKSPEPTRDTAIQPVEDPYLSADTSGPGMPADATGAENINVGDYIDPEGAVAGTDDTVVQVGEYLDPDADFTDD